MNGEEGTFNSKDRQLLARLDERTAHIERDLIAIRADLLRYVTKEAFRPVMLIAYGLAGGTLITVLGVLVSTVIDK